MNNPDFRKDQGPLPKHVANAKMVSVSRYDDDPAMNRLQLLARHFVGYIVVTLVLAAIGLTQDPPKEWFVWFMVAWGAPLAIHVAHTMGLFGSHAKNEVTDNSSRDS